jgi:hypothetical protein
VTAEETTVRYELEPERPITDAAAKAATGKTPGAWFAAVDAFGGREKGRRDGRRDRAARPIGRAAFRGGGRRRQSTVNVVSSTGTTVPSMMKGKPSAVPRPVSTAATQLPVYCCALPVVVCPSIVTGGCHGPE